MHSTLKNQILVFILTFNSFFAIAQEANVQFFSFTKLIPKLRPEMQDITAKEYIIAGKVIKEWTWDKKSPDILLTLKSNQNSFASASTLVNFNMLSSKVNWQREESSNFRLSVKGNIASLQTKRKTTFIDLATGKNLWKTRKVFLTLGPNGKKIYKAKHDGYDEQDMMAKECNVTNGEELNRFQLNYNITNTYCYQINDSLDVISSNGFYAISSSDGLQWKKGEYYDEIRSRENKNIIKGAFFFGALGILVATQNIKKDLKLYGKNNSAIISDSGKHFLFNRQSVLCIDSVGQSLWEIKAPAGMRGDCGLKVFENILFYYSMFTPRKNTDMPISKFYTVNKNTGSLIVKGDISVDGSKLNDLVCKNGALFAAEKNRIKKFEGPSYNFTNQLQIDLHKKVTLDKFVTADYFYEGSQLIKRMESDSSRVFFTSTANTVYAANTKLSSFETIDKSKVLKQVGVYKNWKVLQGPEKVVIIDSAGKPVASFACKEKCAVQGSVLLFNGPNSLLEVDLEQLAGQ